MGRTLGTQLNFRGAWPKPAGAYPLITPPGSLGITPFRSPDPNHSLLHLSVPWQRPRSLQSLPDPPPSTGLPPEPGPQLWGAPSLLRTRPLPRAPGGRGPRGGRPARGSGAAAGRHSRTHAGGMQTAGLPCGHVSAPPTEVGAQVPSLWALGARQAADERRCQINPFLAAPPWCCRLPGGRRAGGARGRRGVWTRLANEGAVLASAHLVGGCRSPAPALPLSLALGP